ncbi:DUF2269 domain-containing protein [Pseudomonas neustonica]|uniref:DUF2269 domain-containing protein n=1 Tax=Pseudomonas neustonica TaxID=2487346 RepID=A0ABX9XCW1_9PSED|nr:MULTISPECIES: DUF2269 domain-containing protein [Pseudomonas]ROZ80011.1 DUF2269 domain-containing protein [Pseudomonas sp. SSM44]ROZ80647.1 DUF2269 domain-containing protein [Pseudomonas neustonica]|tara:strand:+ start:334 stop:807 length:474 start_codon:yes stop_codon:yes gene_type:complete
MDNYLLLKLLHILSAAVLAGTGTGIAFFMFMAHRSGNLQALVITTRHVVLADWLFTAPAVVVQFTTGLMLMQRIGLSFTSPWFFTALGLFLFIGLCWLPVVVIQYRLRALAASALHSGQLDPAFAPLMRCWTALGIPAFAAIVVLFWLMVFKPLPLI